ncbi:MAG: PAS/PAC sensor signal transduction histidine kinase [Microgenomates group bacterium GW2011_GWA1_48_10]|uniref:histidine kinase n=1 Tax=Candidatus Gottesmanbacteria bacterium RIFCSPHIGHO2_01_FULL_47_48 TaxID=1798381 RepID=A0A1F6A4D3_9BACT|nr:MAG: PAS/PAC sensor signal transduction histidine kinase [Microgenomates group bacterium GW2011_GWA1_48_10]OGG19600.1 MAG: hypothetical protein A2721_02915 [Candidatus Gottesmanbacteria bacterium RIFCSPHIGHO2_01_FULL_47_48]
MTEAARIYKSSVKFLAPLSLEQTFKKISEETMKLAEADDCTIHISDREGNLTRVFASDHKLYNIPVRKEGYTHTVYQTKESKILTADQIIKVHPETKKTRINSDMIIPLTYHGKSLGVLSCISYSKTYTPFDLQILELFAPFASLAILRAQALGEQEEAVRTRDLFISLAAHEFRTPLTTINGYLELMQQKTLQDKPISPEWIDLTLFETKRLIKLVNELLEADQISNNRLKYDFQTLSLCEVVHRAVEIIQVAKPNRKAIVKDKLKYQKDNINGDFDKLLQVFLNLLNNANKYSPPNSPITIILGRVKSSLFVTVQDQGVGIPKEEIPFVLQGFYKGSQTKHTEGMGLGLYVAQRILRRHEGSIKISSKLGKGTNIKVLLPKG